MKRLVLVAVLIGGAGLAFQALQPADAAVATGSFNVTATIQTTCTISAANLAFGTYDPGSASPTDGTSTLSVRCTLGTPATVTLGQGLNPDSASTGTAPVRRMKNTGSNTYLSYYLYQDAGRGTVWGNIASAGVAYSGTGLTDTLTVYGRLPAGQNQIAGVYQDTVVATVTY